MTKIKRMLAYLLCAAMIITLLPANIAAAATTADTANYVFRYVVYSKTAEVKHGGTDNGNLRVYVNFRDSNGNNGGSSESFALTKDSGDYKEATGSSGATTKPPWMVSSIKLQNFSSNAYKCYRLRLYVEIYNKDDKEFKNRIGYRQVGNDYYPGKYSDEKSGKWIDSTDEHADYITKALSTKRYPSAIDGWDNFGKTEYISPDYNDETGYITAELPGTLTGDEYNNTFGVKYNMFNWDGAGTLSLEVSGTAAEGTKVTKEKLKENGYEETKVGSYTTGYKIKKKSLISYMNKNGVNEITITATLKFLSATFNGNNISGNEYNTTFTKTLTIRRSAFEIWKVTYSSDAGGSGLYKRDKDYYYFNGNTSKITAKVDVYYANNDKERNDTWSHFTSKNLKDATVYFNAQLQLGKDTNAVLPATATEATIDGSSDFYIDFNLPEGVDSNNVGVTLMLSDAYFVMKGGTEKYYLTTYGTNYVNNSDAKPGSDSLFAGAYKVDTVSPEAEFEFGNAADESGWRQQALLNYSVSEDLYTSTDDSTMAYRLKDKNSGDVYYVLNDGSSQSATVDTGAATASSSSTITVAAKGTAVKGDGGKTTVTQGGVEADGVLELYGTTDVAGNPANTVFENVKLDTLAPRAQLKSSTATNGGSMSVTYTFRVEDATQRSKVYYVFTEGSDPAPTFDPDAEISEPSGTIEATIGKWAYLSELASDASDEWGNPVNGAAYLKVEKGGSFNGKLYWFTQDSLGNTSKTTGKDIAIDNENTECSVIVSDDTSHPLKNYNIDITTDSGNTVFWRWKKADGGEAIADYREYESASVTGSGTQTDVSGNEVMLDGEWILELEVRTQLGKVSTYTKTLEFDNSAPTIGFTNKDAGTFRRTQTIKVKAEDSSGIRSAAARIVYPDGSAVEGCEEYALIAEGGTVNEDMAVSNLESGAYAVTVSAIDNNGFESTAISNPFYIRSAAPEMSVSAVKDMTFGEDESPIYSENEYTLNVSVNEPFNGAAGSQTLYWRAADAAGEYGAWTSAGQMTASDTGYALDFTLDTPIMLTEGVNDVSVQTIIASGDVNPTNLESIDADIIAEDTVTLYYDATEPQYILGLTDEHTDGTIVGNLALSDNLDGDITIDTSAAGDAISIEAQEDENTYTVTVSENLNIAIYAIDEAGNKAEIPIIITGIDKTAPAVSHETPSTDTAGDRTFAMMSVTAADAAEYGVRFALVPEADLSSAVDSDGNIKDEYFIDSISEDETDTGVESALDLPEDCTAFTADVTEKTAADYDNEYDLKYLVTLKGISGKYYVGVRAEDSLGNTKDTLFTDAALTPQDAETKIESYSVTPKTAYGKAKVTAEFNVPVYVLPQDMITDTAEDDMTVEETNLANAEKYSSDHAMSRSFIITGTGTYALYTADELGRTKRFDLAVTADDVTFDDTLDVTAQTVVISGTYDYETDTITETSREVMQGDNYAAPSSTSDGDVSKYTVIEVSAPDGYTIFPDTIFSTDGTAEWDDEEGVRFWTQQSQQYMTDSGGYTRLVYETSWLYSETDDSALEKYERAINLYLIDAADGSEIPVTVYSGNIDNTRPQGTITLTPDAARDEEGNPKAFTPGDVTADVTFSDAQSGLKYLELYDIDGGETANYDVRVPLVDDDGNPIGYIDTPYTYSNDYIDLTVYGDADARGIKKAEIVFKQNTEACILAENGTGEISSLTADGDSALIIDYINKSEIAESDYTVSYYYKDNTGAWNPITDGMYYKTAKAVIEPTESGTERGVYVANNNGSSEKQLNSFDREFTFMLADKYGYKREVTAELSNFDETAGEISYSLATTGKTNKPIDITITVSDDESGVDTVTLKRGSENIPLTDTGGGIFTGQVSNIGNHTITLTDKAGNIAQKVFIVSDIDAVLPTITNIDYSTTARTAKTVSAVLSYSKPGVTLTKVESASGIDEADYSVDYVNSIIRFSESGSVNVWFTDEYGNTGADVVTVGNIYKTPPALEAVMTVADKKTSVDVSFKKAVTSTGADVDTLRSLSEITVDYNGIAQLAEDENGEKAVYTFNENGKYTFKVYDTEGISSYLTIEITDIDKSEPKITQVRWSYDYDVLENGEWVTKTIEGARDVGDEYGYRIATDVNPVTNGDVTVTVVTDAETVILDNEDSEMSTEHTIVYPENGMYIFNMQKANGLTDSYGFDVGVIDTTAPVIDLAAQELVFYENPNANAVEYSKDLITKAGTAFEAYDIFGGKQDLSDRVTIDLGEFNADDITQNKFDRNSPYTITYTVTDDAHNTTETQMTVRLVGYNDTVAFVNGQYPDYAGRTQVSGDSVNISLYNFSGISYARMAKGVKTLGQMKTIGTTLSKNEEGGYTFTPTEKGWYTVLVQTDKRDYFNLQIYVTR